MGRTLTADAAGAGDGLRGRGAVGAALVSLPIHDNLGIGIREATPERVVLEMDVTSRVHQPVGLLHGGASALMAESAASIGGFLNCDGTVEYVVGIDLNISHLRARRSGKVIATATPVRVGRSVHVWDIRITDEADAPVSVARCTLAVRPLQGGDSAPTQEPSR
jgi:1,4-dihydroxy-2-naphthoyl-CoA hydrolase